VRLSSLGTIFNDSNRVKAIKLILREVMKLQVLEILWHTTRAEESKPAPVLGLDFTHDRIVASGGADTEVKVNTTAPIAVVGAPAFEVCCAAVAADRECHGRDRGQIYLRAEGPCQKYKCNQIFSRWCVRVA
jgi:hypothetical protein